MAEAESRVGDRTSDCCGHVFQTIAQRVAHERKVERGLRVQCPCGDPCGDMCSEGEIIFPDGCVGGHHPDLVSCEIGADWP